MSHAGSPTRGGRRGSVRRSSLEGFLSEANEKPKTKESSFRADALYQRIIRSMAMRQIKQDPDDDSDEEDEDLDLMEDDYLELLCTPPGNRKPMEVDGIMEVLRRYASDLTESISEENLGLVASTCLYHFFAPGEVVCEPNEHADFYFVLLRGTVDVEEPTLHHQEHLRGLNDADPSWQHRRKRTTEFKEGQGFHHLPLATSTEQYGYKAFVGDWFANGATWKRPSLLHSARRW